MPPARLDDRQAAGRNLNAHILTPQYGVTFPCEVRWNRSAPVQERHQRQDSGECVIAASCWHQRPPVCSLRSDGITCTCPCAALLGLLFDGTVKFVCISLQTYQKHIPRRNQRRRLSLTFHYLLYPSLEFSRVSSFERSA